MKTTKIAASLLSLAVILPGLIVSNSVPAQARYKPVCPSNYTNFTIKEGYQLKDIAKALTGIQNNWVKILNPSTKEQFSEEEASNLAVGDIVCLPNSWVKRR